MSFGIAVARRPQPGDPCPCGSGNAFEGCCAPLLAGGEAPSAERLMRSRFTAFALHDAAHLARTWHPRTRPDDLTLDAATRWVHLEVLSAEERGDRAVVAFRARWTRGGDAGVLSERSRFERRARRWVYVDGDVDPA